MISWINKKMKSEKGAISAFALMSMAFFLIFIVSIFIYFSRMENIQAQTLRVLADKYGDGKPESEIVSTLVSNEADVIPIYTLEQLRDIGSNKYITVPQEEGKIYHYYRKEDLFPDDGSEGRARYRLMQNWYLDELKLVLEEVANNATTDANLFVGLEENQALGMYIVNFPEATAGDMAVTKTLIDYSASKGQYHAAGAKFVYEIVIRNTDVVNIEYIEIVDMMWKTTKVDDQEVLYKTTDSIQLYTDKPVNCVGQNPLTQTFDLNIVENADGTLGESIAKIYAIYTTVQDDVNNKYTLENHVEVKGKTNGRTITKTAKADDIIEYVKMPEYTVNDNLIVWYDGIDNMASVKNAIGGDLHSTVTTTWYDKAGGTLTDAEIENLVTNNFFGNNSWQNKYLQIGRVEYLNEDRTLVNFSETTELENIIQNFTTDSNNPAEYEFCIQLVFEPKSEGTIYSFRRAENINITNNTERRREQERYGAIVYENERITIKGDNGSTTITNDFPRIIENQKYILCVQGKYSRTSLMNDEMIYGLNYEAYLYNGTTFYDTDGKVEKFEVISLDRRQIEEETITIGFDYNRLGRNYNLRTGGGNMNMNLYSFRLYDRMLTENEINNNMNVDISRFF